MAALLFCSCETEQEQEFFRLAGPTMGTAWHAVVVPENAEDALSSVQLTERVGFALDAVNAAMSTYLPSSELSKFALAPQDTWFPVSELTQKVAEAALYWAEKTNGAFDPTVMPLVNLWSFGPETRQAEAPSDEAMKQTLYSVGWQNIQLRTGEQPALQKIYAKTSLDFSAIAKGFGTDQAFQALRSSGSPGFLIEVGGEMRVFGEKAPGQPWVGGIEQPDSLGFGTEIAHRIRMPSGTAMATSGDYRNWRMIDGKRVSHTIDPRTGHPVRHGVASATVLAEDCMTADALATALCVLEPKAGLELIHSLENIECVLFVRTAEGFEELQSEGFQDFLLPALEPTAE
ncbi:MAG: FAD:protein FMN transferase [Planctomycetes bacterium]|nr:FAD:protein FMN transferase [Planctomycetota bacterium]